MRKDPRGPLRRTTLVEWKPDVALVTKECGHICRQNQTMTHEVGELSPCWHCGKENNYDPIQGQMESVSPALWRHKFGDES